MAAAARENVIAFIQVSVAFFKGFRFLQSAWALESIIFTLSERDLT